MLEYGTNLNLVRSMDLSNNKLSGEIPVEVTSLVELISLNLSHNLLTGIIPEKIGEMRSLESVDFSVNKLSDSIPESMSSLSFLSHLNLSYNNLSGEIPLGTQLESFDPSSYNGNHLYGLPLPKKHSANVAIHNGGGGNDNGFEMEWFYFGMLYGFGMGFWSVFATVVINRR
ncbi:hypothetical protein Golob_004406 [Gossypium lobatum]|uniref:Uncharacterized protein n=1 Tax=Gossypium lobatum TaxID=34289 RepID=A0A7J8N1C3_9ROSI|nr:hypothetical protein [Gossypium lobatum]